MAEASFQPNLARGGARAALVAAFATSPLPVCILDGDRRVAWANPSFTVIAALPQGQATGYTLAQVVPGGAERLAAALDATRASGAGAEVGDCIFGGAAERGATPRRADIVVQPLRAGEGEDEGWLLVVKTVADGGAEAERQRERVEGHLSSVRPGGEVEAKSQASLSVVPQAAEPQESRAQLEAVLAALPVGVAVLDAKGGAVLVNPEFERIWSGPRPPVRSVEDYWAYRAWWVDSGEPLRPEDWASAVAVAEGRAVLGQVLQIERFDGSRAFVVNSGVPIRDDSGRVVGCAVAIMDISERMASEERYRALFDHLSEGFAVHELVYDAEGRAVDYRFLEFNDAFVAQTGLTRERAIGRTVREVLPDIEPSWIDRYAEVVATGRPARFDSYTATLGRHYSVVAFRSAPDRFATLVLDVTQQKRAEAEREQLLVEMRKNAVELDCIFRSMAEGVLVYDTQGNVVRSNPAAVHILGRDPKGATLRDVVAWARPRFANGKPVEWTEMAVYKALRGEETQNLHMIVEPGGVTRDILVSAAPLWIEDRIEGAVVLWRDATALMELDRQKEQFISVAAHELKTPVAIMKGYAQALLRSAEEPSPRRRRMLEAVDRGADRIGALVDDLLDIARLQAGALDLTFARFDLAELVSEVSDRVALAANAHSIQVAAGRPVAVCGDRGRLEQVVLSLLDNAVRYSPDGGEIEVAVSANEREAVVTVRDHGVGIPREKQSGIFQRFFRAHTGTPHDYGGMGVSLYISREIVARHGGRIWFESQPGRGATFGFSLPLGAEGE